MFYRIGSVLQTFWIDRHLRTKKYKILKELSISCFWGRHNSSNVEREKQLSKQRLWRIIGKKDKIKIFLQNVFFLTEKNFFFNLNFLSIKLTSFAFKRFFYQILLFFQQNTDIVYTNNLIEKVTKFEFIFEVGVFVITAIIKCFIEICIESWCKLIRNR